MENAVESTSNTSLPSKWCVGGHRVPKGEIVYLCQMTIVLVVVLSSVVNLTLARGSSEIWISLLSSCIGYVLPNPSIRKT